MICASHSLVPGSERAVTTTVFSGLKCYESFKNSSRYTLWQRMFGACCLSSRAWYSSIVLLTWKPLATKCGRLLFRLAPSTPRTAGTEFGLWPTPEVPNGGRGMPKDARMEGNTVRTEAGRKVQVGLHNAVTMWPTPKGEPKMLPTPCSVPESPASHRQLSGQFRRAMAEHLLPIAKGRDWKGQGQRGIHAPGDSLANGDRGDGKPIGGQLNPAWVELLMGYPRGWTDVGVTDGKTESPASQPE